MSADKRPGRDKANASGKITFLRAALLSATAFVGFGGGTAVARPILHGGAVQEVRLGADSGARYGNRFEDRRFSRDSVRRFHDRVEWAFSRGALNRGEADRLHFRADALDDLARVMARRNGLDYYEREELDNRFADLRAQFRRMVWDRDYRGSHREEWRKTRDDEERYWRDDDRDDDRGGIASGDDYAVRDDRPAPALKGTMDDWTPPELGKSTIPPLVSIAPPQPYRAQQPVPPATRKPSPAQKPMPAPSAQDDDQPFKDGRDFH